MKQTTSKFKRTKRNVANLYRRAAKFFEEHPDRWIGFRAHSIRGGKDCYCTAGAICMLAGVSPSEWGDDENYPGSRTAEATSTGLGPIWSINDDLFNGAEFGEISRRDAIKSLVKRLRMVARHLDHGGSL